MFMKVPIIAEGRNPLAENGASQADSSSLLIVHENNHVGEVEREIMRDSGIDQLCCVSNMEFSVPEEKKAPSERAFRAESGRYRR